jgi:hypothetical protein
MSMCIHMRTVMVSRCYSVLHRVVQRCSALRFVARRCVIGAQRQVFPNAARRVVPCRAMSRRVALGLIVLQLDENLFLAFVQQSPEQ